ncbi:bifunctional adenosylcobinamide kinase/adenosylcobinamide-phosphate guanylyltransferase [Sphaerisporangium sp. TRM90804]|uniref:bifunctional adenosylcobinamide kinase/adenosylcobinamide-phosphate guanylyltransferase n=1 Tax=Sphaerisporangium sp. TRM90804 TaxID=3031113 RepID=UPI00244C2DCC|nr:bifunctional adenosylcobinamide kinase/adenosylcobinamide-phosphate guanylyltransferase [Sphaerisporangium sp. TRM90804]MDH2424588.1 bifunctional adenosylcobinamide kinase/adenosylcobinamide-phosphate guanylyltransferase [Sphaerisporangium sp. TRM90804]
MKVLLSGTAGPYGWPEPACGCASCGRLSPGHRLPTAVVIDDVIRLSPPAGLPLSPPATLPKGYRMTVTPDGYAVSGPDHGRVLHATAGEDCGAPSPSWAEEAYDLVLIDLLDRPQRLGDLRRRGLVAAHTQVVAVHLDHRLSSEAELERRLAFWGAQAVRDGTTLDTRVPAPARPAPPRRTLVIGGARSGKSAEAEMRLIAEPDVTYVATGPAGGRDPEWLARVRAHQRRRPPYWTTIETTELAALLRSATGPLLVDGLGTWLAAVFDGCGAWGDPAYDRPRGRKPGRFGTALDAVAARCDELVAAWRQTRAQVIAVSDEVGLSVVPATASGRVFRDALGRLNERLAAESEKAALVVAGRVIPLQD